jgi:toxin ParE1/3/4
MAAKLFWRPQARKDLLAIYEFIALENPDAAERLFTSIESRVALLSSLPRLGPRRPEIRPTTRVLVQRPYLVLYEIQPDSDEGPIEVVEIVRVVDGRRDLIGSF